MPPAQPTTQDEPDTPDPDEPDSTTASQYEPIRVELICHADETDAGLSGWLDLQVHRAIELCDLTDVQLNLVIVADDEMAQLHEQYTGVPGTTDVLTFNMSDPVQGDSHPASSQSPACIEADLILCLDEARRQAKQRNHQPREELLLYAVHGLMHLLGEDDHDEEAYERMHAREDDLLQKMGFGPLFDPDRKPDHKP